MSRSMIRNLLIGSAVAVATARGQMSNTADNLSKMDLTTAQAVPTTCQASQMQAIYDACISSCETTMPQAMIDCSDVNTRFLLVKCAAEADNCDASSPGASNSGVVRQAQKDRLDEVCQSSTQFPLEDVKLMFATGSEISQIPAVQEQLDELAYANAGIPVMNKVPSSRRPSNGRDVYAKGAAQKTYTPSVQHKNSTQYMSKEDQAKVDVAEEIVSNFRGTVNPEPKVHIASDGKGVYGGKPSRPIVENPAVWTSRPFIPVVEEPNRDLNATYRPSKNEGEYHGNNNVEERSSKGHGYNEEWSKSGRGVSSKGPSNPSQISGHGYVSVDRSEHETGSGYGFGVGSGSEREWEHEQKQQVGEKQAGSGYGSTSGNSKSKSTGKGKGSGVNDYTWSASKEEKHGSGKEAAGSYKGTGDKSDTRSTTTTTTSSTVTNSSSLSGYGSNSTQFKSKTNSTSHKSSAARMVPAISAAIAIAVGVFFSF